MMCTWESFGNRISVVSSFIALILSHAVGENPATTPASTRISRPCSELRPGQFLCQHPSINSSSINSSTQQLDGCQPNNWGKKKCLAAPGIVCDGLGVNGTFWKDVPCKYTNGYSFEISVLLAVLLGMFGIDRFYLGYFGIGLFKLCTLGGFFVFQLVDIILLASGKLGPADGSHFVVPYYGPGAQILKFSPNHTYLRPSHDF